YASAKLLGEGLRRRRMNVSGALITAVHTGGSALNLTSRPSQSRKANGASIWPNTSRSTRAAPAGLGLSMAIVILRAFSIGPGRLLSTLPTSSKRDEKGRFGRRARPPPSVLAADGLHHLRVLERPARRPLENDLAPVDGIETVGDARRRHEVRLGDQQ